MTSTSRSLRMPTMSAVGPGAFSMTWLRYLPRPSWVIPRSTVTPGARPRVARIRPVLAVASVLGHDVSPLLLLDRGDVGRLGLAADMKDPLDDCDDGADEDDAEGELDRRRADARPGEDDAERDDHEADLAGHDPDGGQAHA